MKLTLLFLLPLFLSACNPLPFNPTPTPSVPASAMCPTLDVDKDYDDDPFHFLELSPELEARVLDAARRAVHNPNINMPVGEILGFAATFRYTPTVLKAAVAVQRSDGSWYYRNIKVQFEYTGDPPYSFTDDHRSFVDVYIYERPGEGCIIESAIDRDQHPRTIGV